MYDPEQHDVITERPSFDELVEISVLVEDVRGALAALSDGQDTIQRAADLVTAGDNLQEAIHNLCLMEKGES